MHQQRSAFFERFEVALRQGALDGRFGQPGKRGRRNLRCPQKTGEQAYGRDAPAGRQNVSFAPRLAALEHQCKYRQLKIIAEPRTGHEHPRAPRLIQRLEALDRSQPLRQRALGEP